MPRKLPFLTLFFIVLGVLFAAAVVLRVRSYQVSETTTIAGAPDSAHPDDGAIATRAAAGTGTHTEYEIVTEDGRGPQSPDVTPASGAPRGSAPSAREQRYNELLRTAPPAARGTSTGSVPGAPGGGSSAVAPQPEPSIIKRAASAIANVFGGRSDPPATVSRPVQQPPSTSTEKPKPPADPVESDPDSDTRPPQLLSAEFQPQQIKDGETTTFLVQVTDDLSGVASVSGVISSPSNAVQGFACQREAETGRYVARITVPAEAAEGVWKVSYLTLTDNARNSVNLTAAAGMLPPTASFRVTSSAPDSAGPQLKAMWIDRPAMRAGERNTIYVQADDEKSGVSSVNGVLISPSRTARLGFNCQLKGAQWECVVSPPSCLDCGLWSVEQIQLEDKARNMTSFRGDNPIVKQATVDITGEQCDSQPPVMSGVTLSEQVVSNTEAHTIVARAMVTDDVCGVLSVSGQAVGPGTTNPPRLYFSFDRQGDTWTANISVPRHAARGTWVLSWIQVLDRGNNLKAYSDRDPGLAGVAFTVR